MSNTRFSKVELEKYESKHIFGVKECSWAGEDEVRILVTLKDEVFRNLDKDKEYAIAYDLPNDYIGERKSITCGPECDEENLKNLVSSYSMSGLLNKVRVPFWKDED
ncbi:hypothetical protein [Pseudobutyrivibrio sp. MD2005]|uniref:hypothetical protein n=1 Tax=Pseudobutyrivibrio sp. MD2005 TaxID=1410616 RepID=UPI00048751CA|nr:hypothetical protein [Pseudobutyrivibrio sp. MD2005]